MANVSVLLTKVVKVVGKKLAQVKPRTSLDYWSNFDQSVE